MNDQHIAWLEANLERLVEGAFAGLFGKHLGARDIALELARSMEGGVQRDPSDPSKFIAPDHYAIYVQTDIYDKLIDNQPNLSDILGNHIVELAAQAGYTMTRKPSVEIIPTGEMPGGQIMVNTSHTNHTASSTGIMAVVESPQQETISKNPHLIINGDRIVALESTIINVGRSNDNEIVVDDNYVSRHHLQLRLRFGTYTLFDVQSTSGTYVNNVAVREHRLQSGDVIRIGHSQIVYIEDNAEQTGTTQAMEPVDF